MLSQSLQAARRMEVFLRVTLALLSVALAPRSAPADASIPDTPARHTLQAFLDDSTPASVEPDVKVSAAEALATAEKLAADKLANKGK